MDFKDFIIFMEVFKDLRKLEILDDDAYFLRVNHGLLGLLNKEHYHVLESLNFKYYCLKIFRGT